MGQLRPVARARVVAAVVRAFAACSRSVAVRLIGAERLRGALCTIKSRYAVQPLVADRGALNCALGKISPSRDRAQPLHVT